VIVGGGFGGLYAARALAGAALSVTLVDRRNHHLFQPLLYQVATAALAAPDIAAPIRRVLREQTNATVLLADVTAIDTASKRVVLDDGELTYDYLVLAAGMESGYFGHDAWEAHAPSLKTLEDAFEVRRRIFSAFERAEREPDADARRPWLTFCVIGAGPTGVELAGALREIATRTLARDFRNFDPAETRVVIVDLAERVLPAFPEALSNKARALLERRGVELRLGARVTGIDAAGVQVGDEQVPARTVLWAAGVRPSPLAGSLGAPLARDGRVAVEPDLSIAGHPQVFVVGDLAAVRQSNGEWVPGMAPGAIQEGRHAARNIRRLTAGDAATPFRYADRGMLATIGRAAAVARIGRLELAGFTAWVLWLVVHVFWLVGFRSRVVVTFEWAWAYFTYQRSARVLVGRRPTPGS
jgi:NADH dehydrogenase